MAVLDIQNSHYQAQYRRILNYGACAEYSTAERDAIIEPIRGQTLYNTSTDTIEAWNGTAWAPLNSPAEDWQEVGATGNPSFQNSWTNHSTAYNSVAYRRLGEVVYLRGVAKSGNDEIIFTLPTDYRPDKETIVFGGKSTSFKQPNTFNGAAARFNINANGDVELIFYSSTWTSLDGISFAL